MTYRSRGSAVIAVGVLMLGACSGQGESAPPATTGSSGADPSGADGDSGAADPGRVVALDDFAAMSLLTLGVEPDLTFEAFGYDSTERIFAAEKLATQPYGSELDLEQVAAADPDVLIGVSLPTTVSVQPKLSQLAPTTVLDYTASWQEALRATAAAVGRADRAEEVITSLTEESEKLKAELAASPRAGAVVSVLGDNPDFFSPPAASGVGSVLSAVGLNRPAAQAVATTADSPFVQVSAERLRDHDGDVLFLLAGGAYATTDLTGSPLYPQLGAASRAIEVSGEVWLAPSAFSTDWILRDLRSTLLDDGAAAPTSAAAERFAAFSADT